MALAPAPVSNEALSIQIKALSDLVIDLRDRDVAGICSRLDDMNGRERVTIERVSRSEANIQTLKWRVDTVEEDLKSSINVRTLVMGVFSTAQSFVAYLLSK
jgi:hypothetical protein